MTKLSLRDAEQRVAKLRDLINDYRYHYHVLNESIMSDEAADSLKHELSTIEDKYPALISPDSPSQRVAGKAIAGFKQVAHSNAMLSLNDVFDEDEINAWQERIKKLLPTNTKLEYFVDIKMDGLACALIYEDGMLETAITRGDGLVGEDVTQNIRTIESIPLKLRDTQNDSSFVKGITEVRGEIIMYKDDFIKLNDSRRKEGKPLFANPRNTAAGTIRQLDPQLVANRSLYFRAYDLIRDNPSEIKTYQEAYKAAAELGFLNNTSVKVLRSIKEIIECANLWEKKRQSLPYNTDGLVIKVNDRRLYNRLGVVGKAPRAAIAYKYAAEQATTKVIDIFVSIGRTGAATPVAMLEPVIIAGSKVQMATLHNEGEIVRKDIRKGDTVIVHKAGDIIPEVIAPIIKLRTGQEKAFIMPKKCPECDTKLVKKTKDEAIWRCPNNHCPSRTYKRIEHFASKAALDIDGLGEKNVIALLDAELINDPADLYSLKKERLLKLDRFADVSANNLINAIRAKSNPALGRFVYALGIRHIGIQTAIDLANHFRDFNKITQATIEELAEIEGIGEVVAESTVEWFSELNNQKLLAKFYKNGLLPQTVKKIGGKLDGINVAITGTLDSLSREQAADNIRSLGGTFQSAVGSDTTYLVVGSNVGASKLTKANKLGTKQIDESEFLKLL